MNTIKFALAAALVVAAGSTSFAGGLDEHDPQAVNAQALTNSYSAPSYRSNGENAAQTDAYQTPGNSSLGLTDAERITVIHNESKDIIK